MALRRPMTARLAHNPEVKIAHDAWIIDNGFQMSCISQEVLCPLPIKLPCNGVASDKIRPTSTSIPIAKARSRSPNQSPAFLGAHRTQSRIPHNHHPSSQMPTNLKRQATLCISSSAPGDPFLMHVILCRTRGGAALWKDFDNQPCSWSKFRGDLNDPLP